MVKYVIKDKHNKYYGFHGFGSYLSEADLFDDEKKPQELIEGRRDIFKDGPYEIVKVSKEEILRELPKYPEARKARNILEDKLLNVRNHYDSVLTFLGDPSLIHDMNAAAGRIARECEAAGMKYESKDAFEYSETVCSRVCRDKNGNWLPDKMLQDNNLAQKARKAATFFATMADALALLDKYEEFYAEKMNEK